MFPTCDNCSARLVTETPVCWWIFSKQFFLVTKDRLRNIQIQERLGDGLDLWL